MIEEFAKDSGFKITYNFTDKDNYFVDSLWEKL
jgi:L-histidine N-alpha-methyltransferase